MLRGSVLANPLPKLCHSLSCAPVTRCKSFPIPHQRNPPVLFLSDHPARVDVPKQLLSVGDRPGGRAPYPVQPFSDLLGLIAEIRHPQLIVGMRAPEPGGFEI